MKKYQMSISAYTKLLNLYEDQSILSSIRGVLSWDIETSKMPARGLKHRSKQFSLISKFSHRFWQSEEISKLLSDINMDKLEDQIQNRNIHLLKRSHKVQKEISEDLVIKLSSQANKTNNTWKKAKQKVDFSIVTPEMKKLIELNKEYASSLAKIKGIDDPLDALIDERDEGLTSSKIESYFDQARKFLIPFIKKQASRFEGVSPVATKVNLSKDEKIRIARLISDYFGYVTTGDQARGVIGEVEHPLTITCGPDDVRITVKYESYMKVISSINHELGHALHGLHKKNDWRYQPVNDYGFPSLAECNSRYTENKIGKSYEYYVYFYPYLNEIAHMRFNEISVDEFYDCVRSVQPGTSRMKADEVTYGIHIIIRSEIERMLFDDQVQVEELPQIWNDKYYEYLGVDVPNDTMGIMQDLHWYSYYYGYFHGYFMGDLMGSQLHFSMQKDLPNWRAEVAAGDLSGVINWHAKNIYSKGALYTPLELVEEVTGESLNIKYFTQYLRNKYND